jgi:sec-independent protein translocase protein TatA
MPSLGAPELLIILVIVLLIFGAGKLPQIGNALGRSIREFRETSEGKDAATTTTPTDTTPSEQKKSGL